MNTDWQDLLALGVVAAAVGYLIWYIARSLRQKTAGCGSGCSSCGFSGSGDSLGKTLPLVTLSPPAGHGMPETRMSETRVTEKSGR